MGSITSAASNGTDKSMSALQLIYGAIASNPLSGGSATTGTASGGLISQVFLVLNSCILAVGVLWAMYHFGSAMIATGQDGEFLGQKKSSPWFIIRMGVGFTGLVPMFGGYCGAQVIMLWATMMGVGIANLSMSSAVNVLTNGGTLIATPVVPQVTALTRSLFESNLCAAAANQAVANLQGDANVDADPGETFSANTTSMKVVLMNRNGLSCGGAQITGNAQTPAQTSSSSALSAYTADMASVQQQLLSAQGQALVSLQATLASAAQAYVAAVNNQSQPIDPQATIEDAAKAYQTEVQATVTSASSSLTGVAGDIGTELTRDGWIMLGSWYQTFAQTSSQLEELADTVPVAVPPTDLSNLPYPQLYQSVMAAYALQLQQDASTSTGTSTMATSSNLFAGNVTQDMGIDVLAQLFPGANLVGQVEDLMSTVTRPNNGLPLNPLIVMKSVGDKIIHETVEYLDRYLPSGNAGAGKNPANSAAGSPAGTAAAQPAAGKAGVPAQAEPFAVAMAVTLFFFGVMLSVYMPMLPFIVWFGGVVSWFMVVAEAMVASPLWAMTHLDGDGEGLGHRTQHGYVFLLNVMLRPVVMVFGFLLAGASVIVLGSLLNTMFGIAVRNTQYGSLSGLIEFIGFLVLYVGMCQTLCNSAFSLVHTLPDNLFSWIGGQLASARTGFGEGVKHGFESHTNQASADGHSIGRAPQSGQGSSSAGLRSAGGSARSH
ncbi:hypothetical protein C0Z18_21770 [Trinickia dabaoshanensis]|uniref:DotA/TraY family protein n=1 Tax=Trinickia dabaoshanensis TaxID=564714 RepID=A0A2N7VIX6_9BURK|nr:hypothetical protein C0Z18_21770 [Trinickia dabaoshanensis]